MVIYISRFNKASLNIERCFSASCMADSAEIQYKALNVSRVVQCLYYYCDFRGVLALTSGSIDGGNNKVVGSRR